MCAPGIFSYLCCIRFVWQRPWCQQNLCHFLSLINLLNWPMSLVTLGVANTVQVSVFSCTMNVTICFHTVGIPSYLCCVRFVWKRSWCQQSLCHFVPDQLTKFSNVTSSLGCRKYCAGIRQTMITSYVASILVVPLDQDRKSACDLFPGLRFIPPAAYGFTRITVMFH